MTQPSLRKAHPGIFGVAKESTNTFSWLSSVYEVLDDPPASRPKDGWMGVAYETKPDIAGPYAASSLRRSSSSTGSSGRRSDVSESLVTGAVETIATPRTPRVPAGGIVGPKPRTGATTVETGPEAKPRQQLHQGKMDATRYLIVPGPENEVEATVSHLEVRSVCLEECLSQMQRAVAKLETSSGGAPLVLLHQTDPSNYLLQPDEEIYDKTAAVAELNPTGEHQAIWTVAAEAKQQDDCSGSSGPGGRNGDFMFTPRELLDANQRWNTLMEARQRGAATKPFTHSFRSELRTAQRRGFRSSEESRDRTGEMASLAQDLDPSSDP